MNTDHETPTFIIPLENINNYLRNPEDIFVGRSRVGNKIYTALKNARGNGGCFLIGGYRGAGKTLLVKRQIEALQAKENDRNYRTEEINIDLGVDNEIKTREILCDISESLFDKINRLISHIRYTFLCWQLAFTILLFCAYWPENHHPLDESHFIFAYIGITILRFIYLFIHSLKIWVIAKNLVLSIRYARAIEKKAGISSVIPNVSVKMIKRQEPISTRRIQQQLKTLFRELNRHKIHVRRTTNLEAKRNKASIIRSIFFSPNKILLQKKIVQPLIVFDEIDKINAKAVSTDFMDTKARKEKVDILLGGLKALLNRSKAIFVFIAGREMVDAFHSESGYTSVLYEGVFQDIFYIPTLLSDHSDGKVRKLQSMISEYVDRILTEGECYKTEYENLKKTSKNPEYSEEDVDKYIDERYARTLDSILENKKTINPNKYYLCKSFDFIKKEKTKTAKEKPFKNKVLNIDYFKSILSKNSAGAPLSEKERVDLIDIHSVNFRFIRRIFIRYLALHTRGNCKRLSMMIHEFIESHSETTWNLVTSNNYRILGGRMKKGSAYLLIRPEEIKRFLVSAKLYSLYDTNTARQLSRTDDKLVVSSLITMLDITKFHSRGFSREMLDRTVAGIDVHAESNLQNITDEIINSTFFSIARRTTDNLFQYRFYQSSEIEFFYLCKSMGARASSFEYSLDSADPVKLYYQSELEKQSSGEPDNSKISSAKLKIALGDIYVAERVYDRAYTNYCDAIYLFKSVLEDIDKIGSLNSEGALISSHYHLIEITLKKGLLEEIRENNNASLRTFKEAQEIIQFESEKVEKNKTFFWSRRGVKAKTKEKISIDINDHKEWLTKTIYDNNEAANLNMLVHSMLASDFLSLKSGKTPTSPLYKDLSTFDKDKSVPLFYAKIVTLHFFAMNHQGILHSGKKLYKEATDFFLLQRQHNPIPKHLEHYKKENHFMSSYIYGQAAFSNIADKLRKNQTLLNNHEHQDVTRKWLNTIIKLHQMRFEDIANHQYFSNHLEQDEQSSELPSANQIITSFHIIYCSAMGMEEKGNYSMAAEMFCSIILNWIALLEFAPWSKLRHLPCICGYKAPYTANKNTKLAKNTVFQASIRASTINSIFKNRSSWLENIIEQTGNNIRKSEQGSFNRERNTLFSCNGHTNFNHEVTKILKHFNTDTPDRRYELASLATWFRSNISSYLLIFGIWEQYCRLSIRFWCTKKYSTTFGFDFDIEQLAPPIGSLPRVSAIYLWLRARYDGLTILDQLCDVNKGGEIEFKRLTPTDSHQKFTIGKTKGKNTLKKISDIVYLFSMATDEAKLSSRSDDPDTFPPKPIIYFNLLGLLKDIYQHLCQDDKQFIKEQLDKKNRGVISSLLDINHVKSLFSRHHRDIREIGDISSNAYRRKMRHKFYLYDDFEDPLFIAEWSFLVMISAGAFQLKQMDEGSY